MFLPSQAVCTAQTDMGRSRANPALTILYSVDLDFKHGTDAKEVFIEQVFG
jgi:hypothetical protein